MQIFKHTPKLEERKLSVGSEFIFYCPGCKSYHGFLVNQSCAPNWTFNGDYFKPTFTSSLRYIHSGCHLNITDGVIIYHPDSPHSLKGKTVPMENL